MCGRFTNTLGPQEIGRQIGRPLGVQIREPAGTGRYNIAPTEQVLTIVARDGRPEARMLRWALVPAYADTVKTRKPWINAKSEGLREKGSYFGVAPDPAHRVLILADGFYEWPTPEAKTAKRKSPPMRFVVDGGRVFGFAGLWVTAPHVEDGPVESCTIITCDASRNRVVAPVHDRMPVILADPERMLAWLDPSVSAEVALTLCEALPAERMSSKLASIAVNNVRLPEGPELLVAASEQAAP